MLVSWKRTAFLLAVSLGVTPGARAQARPATAAPRPAPPAAPTPKAGGPAAFTLKVTAQRSVTFIAGNAKAVDIAVALEKELKVPVRMSPLVARQMITRKLERVPLEDLLLALAPQVYLDYEVRWDRPAEDWVGIELTGFNEREPSTPVEPRAFMVLAGSTDDEGVTEETLSRDQAVKDEETLRKDPPKEGPVLDISVKDGLVSIRARKQMVTAILLDVASKAGMGFETRGQLDEAFIDLDVRGLPVEQLPAVVARPNFGVLMRRNVTTGVSRPVAVLLGTEATRVRK